MSNRRLHQDRLLAVISILMLLAYGVSLFLARFDMRLGTFAEFMTWATLLYFSGMFLYCIIDPIVANRKIIKARVSVREIERTIRTESTVKPEFPQTVRVGAADKPMAFRFSVYLIVLATALVRGSGWVLIQLTIDSARFFLVVLYLLMVVGYILYLAATVNVIGLFVPPKATEVGVFYDQIHLHIPDEGALIITKTLLQTIAVEYPRSSFWQSPALYPNVTFAFESPVAAIELTPELALALRNFGFGPFVSSSLTNQPAPIND